MNFMAYLFISMTVAFASIGSKALPMSELEKFLKKSNKDELPQRFNFQILKFVPGKVRLIPGAETEIKKVVSILQTFPKAKVKIEGFCDTTRFNEEENTIATRRAMTVDQQLVDRGIEQSRVSHEGKNNQDGPSLAQIDLIIEGI